MIFLSAGIHHGMIMELTLDQALQKAVEAHKAGQIQEAERLYTAILQAQPKHPDANHNMGVLAVGVGKIQEALPFFKTALEANPSMGQYWLSCIDALIKLDRIADAKAVFDQAKEKGISGEAFDQLEASLNPNNATGASPEAVQLIKKAIIYRESGDFTTAIKLLTNYLVEFPGSAELLSLLAHCYMLNDDAESASIYLIKANGIDPDNVLVSWNNVRLLLRNKNVPDALMVARKTIERYPNDIEGMSVLGSCLRLGNEFDESLLYLNKALSLNPDYAEALINRGLIKLTQKDKSGALSDLETAHKLKPHMKQIWDLVISLNVEFKRFEQAISFLGPMVKSNPSNEKYFANLGLCYQHLGNSETAIENYQRALEIKPDSAEAYNNIGIILRDKGDFEAAINSYKQALKIKPDYAAATANLVSLLTSYTPQKENLNLIITVNEAIRKIEIPCKSSHIISDEQIVNLFLKSSSSLSGNSLGVRTELSQTYRRNSVDLNCKRHKSIFNEHDIIPEFCFGCYKVQVEPRSIIELIKLYVVFDQLHLKENNTRKCMVELRPEISGFYKGLIYCSGLKQANEIADYLDKVVKQSIGLGLPAKVKRGCSEYSSAFPDYKEINNSGPQLMNYIEEWKVIEEDHDRLNPMHPNENVMESLSGLNLNDVLIMQKWVDYAKGIGDPKADLINETTVYYQEIHDKAKARLKSFQFIR